MLITHRGEGCYGCPFFCIDPGPPEDSPIGDLYSETTPSCNLDGMVPAGEPPLTIKVEDPEKRPKGCPFEDPHGISVEVHCA